MSDYSASEQFDEGFGLDSGREMCRSGISPGYNWMEGRSQPSTADRTSEVMVGEVSPAAAARPAALPSRAQ
ncbi:hypothetical protein ALC60_03827 [Trachymyrmex zeteki]|uniref:Uncharacterized protein n=1 Tax=Mycetomoellerius zeteki TaxID=64791 RepID=A0A151X9W3_9HYME|nr:hypothetical protein ALC60_03827 [Trachymyrmex zeteki]